MINKQGGFGQFGNWKSLLVMAGVTILIFIAARAFLKILYFVAPVLIIATAIINYKVILNYFKSIGNIFKKNPLMGVGAGLLSAFFYPIVIGFLFVQALLYRKSDQIQKEVEREKGEYVEYEELESHEVETDDLLEELNNKKQKSEEELDYWDLLSDDEPPRRS
ncbi:MAG: hypothetical protein ACJAUH_002716 [Saprospiraceae bacterium]|jgi:hypothetical protein|tara:strand:- start:38 stop:529 length:492 start_codon:yes stop_codon:yes gene_type:complete